jgi:hypothetical protein
MALTFRQVRHFIATAETGRVSAAAAGLNVTQSAVTASLKALEAEVGRKLFDRHSNGVTLTFDGQQFLQRARAIEASIADAMRGPHRRGTQVDGTVDVTASYTVAGYFLPPLLSRFWRAFPGITVRLHEFERDAIGHSLMSGSVDAAVMLVSTGAYCVRRINAFTTRSRFKKRSAWGRIITSSGSSAPSANFHCRGTATRSRGKGSTFRYSCSLKKAMRKRSARSLKASGCILRKRAAASTGQSGRKGRTSRSRGALTISQIDRTKPSTFQRWGTMVWSLQSRRVP